MISELHAVRGLLSMPRAGGSRRTRTPRRFPASVFWTVALPITLYTSVSPNQNCTGAGLTARPCGAAFTGCGLYFRKEITKRRHKENPNISVRVPCCSDGDTLSCKYGYFQSHFRTIRAINGHNSENFKISYRDFIHLPIFVQFPEQALSRTQKIKHNDIFFRPFFVFVVHG